ncbi:DUF1572 family protein [Caldibacillus thermoamylovorans]
MNIGNVYLRVVIERFKSVKTLGDKTIEQLSEKGVFALLCGGIT